MKSVSLTTSARSQREGDTANEEGDTANEEGAADERVNTGPRRGGAKLCTHSHACEPKFL